MLMLNNEEIDKRWKEQSEKIIESLVSLIGENLEFVLYPAFIEHGSGTKTNKSKMKFAGKLESVIFGGPDYRPTTVIAFEGGSTIELENYQTIWTVSGSGTLIAEDLNGDQCLDWKGALRFIVEIDRCTI